MGIPLVIAALAFGWFILRRRKAGGASPRPDYLYSGLGTENERQDPLPADPRRKSDPYDFVHQGQTAPVEKDNDAPGDHPQELPS